MPIPDLPIEVLSFDHVAIASWDATGPARMLTDVLGAGFVAGDDEPGPGFRWLQFELPGGRIEVIEPLHRDGFLYRFLTRRGEGVHHVTLKVRDLAGSIGRLTEAGFEPVDVNLEHDTWKEAFLHPRDASGVLIQLAETPPGAPHDVPARGLEEFLADRPDLRRERA